MYIFSSYQKEAVVIVWYKTCSWIYNYLCNQCLSPLMLWIRTPLRRGILDTTLCDKVCQSLTYLRQVGGVLWVLWVSSTIKTYHHDITRILFKVELSTIKPNQSYQKCYSLNGQLLIVMGRNSLKYYSLNGQLLIVMGKNATHWMVNYLLWWVEMLLIEWSITYCDG